MLVGAHGTCLWVVSDCQSGTGGGLLRSCCLVEQGDTGIQTSGEHMAKGLIRVLVDYRDCESEDLLWVCDGLNDVLQVLADQGLDLRLGIL